MVVRDPALVVVLVSAGSGARRLVARERFDDLGLARLLADLGALGLREERLDPRLVNEVEGAAEDAGEEDVQKDAMDVLGHTWQSRLTVKGKGRKRG